MKNRWSNILALLLLCSIGISPMLRVGLITLHKKSIHAKLEKKWKWDAAEILVLPKSQFPDLKKGNEIYFNYDKFDLLEVSDNGDFWKVTAINDKLEKQLEKGLHQDEKTNKRSGKSSLKVVMSDWFLVQKIKLPDARGFGEIGSVFMRSDLASGYAAELLQPPERIGFRYEIVMGSTRKS